MEYTLEQQDYIDNFMNNPLVVIFALAGTGKTTLLVAVAKNNPTLKGIYIVFNVGNKLDALSKFPKNFKVVNVHSLAYGKIKQFYYQLLKSEDKEMLREYAFASLSSVQKKDLKENEVSKILKIDNRKAKSVLSVFNKFLNSAYNEIKGSGPIYQYARELYLKMKRNEIAITHNFYLKEFELLLKSGAIKLSYDILVMDESQDTNMVTLSICNFMKAKYKDFVGDDNQQIYSFRDSINGMDKLVNAKVYYLTETFRFPMYIANIANGVLKTFKGSKILLKSNIAVDEKFNLSGKDNEYCEKIENEMNERCYISRSNSVLIGKMLELVGKNRIFKTIRHPNEIFSLAEEVYYLANFEKTKIWQNKFLLEFNNIDEAERYANNVDDIELLSAIGINNKYGSMILTLKEYAIKFYNDYQFKKDEYKDFLTTAHTCKGLEWNYVSIEDSFPDFISLIVKSECETILEFRTNIKKIDAKIIDEFNLLYVALTRAKKSMRVLDSNEFYLGLEDHEIDKLIYEYRKALEAFKNGDTDSFEYNPKVILGYEEEFSITEDDDIVELKFNDDNEYKQSFDDFMAEQAGFMQKKDLNNQRKEDLSELKNTLNFMGNKNKEKKEEFVKFASSFTSWEKTTFKDGNLSVNGTLLPDTATVGVRIGKGIRIHPMEIRAENNKIVIVNNTQWKYSDLTVIDLIDKIPENLISRYKDCNNLTEEEI